MIELSTFIVVWAISVYVFKVVTTPKPGLMSIEDALSFFENNWVGYHSAKCISKHVRQDVSSGLHRVVWNDGYSDLYYSNGVGEDGVSSERILLCTNMASLNKEFIRTGLPKSILRNWSCGNG